MKSRTGSRVVVLCVSLMVFAGGVRDAKSRPEGVTINYAITGSTSDWSGTFVVNSLTSSMQTAMPPEVQTITGLAGTRTFAPDYFGRNSEGWLDWHDYSGPGGNLSTTSPQLYALIDGGGVWGDVIGNSYDLTGTNVIQAPGQTTVSGDGGIITFTSPGQQSTVPTLSEWGIIALCLGLAALGAAKARRTRVKVAA